MLMPTASEMRGVLSNERAASPCACNHTPPAATSITSTRSCVAHALIAGFSAPTMIGPSCTVSFLVVRCCASGCLTTRSFCDCGCNFSTLPCAPA